MGVPNQRDINSPAYTVTQFSADRTIASNEAGAANVAAVLATVVKDLIDQGILDGTVSVP